MHVFYEPVNLNQWNMFEKVESAGHIETFLATKEMQTGDLIALHVGSQNITKKSGIYAFGIIISEPYILTNHPDDYCNNKNSVDVRISVISYDDPIISHKECAAVINQFRSVHKLNDGASIIIMKVYNDFSSGDYGNSKSCHDMHQKGEMIFPYEINIDESGKNLHEGAVKTILVNNYERDRRARQKCIDYYADKDGVIRCQVCGFDFGEFYGHEYDNVIEVHHIVPLSSIKEDYVIDPINDLIPVCSNCHTILHTSMCLSVEALKHRIEKKQNRVIESY